LELFKGKLLERGGGFVASYSQSIGPQNSIVGLWGVHYQVTDVNRAINFYTQRLGFDLDKQDLPSFGQVSSGRLKLMLTSRDSAGCPSGQDSGASNRVVFQVDDLASRVQAMKAAGFHFQHDIEVGDGGKRIHFPDPDGNPIELFEPHAAADSMRPAIAAVENRKEFVTDWILPLIISLTLVAMILGTAVLLLRP
jgi:glyoxylase I family protein